MRKANSENFMAIALMVQDLLYLEICQIMTAESKIRHFEFTLYLINLEKMVL